MYSMKKKVDRRLAVLSYIRDRAESDGQLPSLAEIAEACGFASRSAAQKHVKALQASGDLDISPGKSRSARPKTMRKAALPTLSSFFEISPTHIGALSDTDLRELVAKLCMARLAVKGFPIEHVSWGGDQRAADGGIDVRVQMSSTVAVNAGFSRALVGIQVKAMKMPENEIRKEMCPGGMLRASIRDIARAGGSYIIASSETTADKPYLDRVGAMKEAAAAEIVAGNAEFDFYDARKLADWTNQHAGVVAWVRSRLGHPLQGWRPYGLWANTRGAKPQPFLDDTSPRLIDSADPDREFSLAEGLSHVRALLRVGSSSVRIVGLSGVGKTRFIQALFEERSAPGALPPEMAIYTDTSDSPNPPPLALLDELLANGRRSVLVVDNCSSQLHSQLTARCKASDCVSLITVEYDIREDMPFETSVFQLERGSAELIEKVINQQFPHISQVNVATICRFAEGNSRVAIALANTLDHNDSLAGIDDEALFERLFWQGRQIDHGLMVAAQVCALVYSFEVEDPNGELQQLASLADMSSLTFYRHVDELLRRGLAQKRGPWRAILPHAIANTLATRALTAVPYPIIASHLVVGQGRLLRSFSRRLGYLHKSPEAVKIVRDWFEDENLLSDIARLPAPLAEVLQNVAPVDLEATLKAVERTMSGIYGSEFVSKENYKRSSIVRLLRSIAWKPEHFEQCLELMLQFALAEPEDNRVDSTRDVIKSLFALYLSGTHATSAQRSAWIRKALQSSDQRIQIIGIQCLDAALEARHFTSHYGFEFGARPRDYGSYPKGADIHAWFSKFINLATEFAVQSDALGLRARDTLASNFRSLWTLAEMVDTFEIVTPQLLKVGWEKGWLAIKQTIRFDVAAMREDTQLRLRALEALSRPKTLIARTKAVVLNSFSGGLDVSDGDSHADAYERAELQARELGEMVVSEPEVMVELLPLIVENRQGRHWMFGAGMATAAVDPLATWGLLVEAYEATPPELRNLQALRGFLNGLFKRDQKLFECVMDDSMGHGALAAWVPVLQLSGDLDEKGCERLLRSMDIPDVPAAAFQYLGYGRATENIPDLTLIRLLERLARKPNGLEVAIDILSMHHYDNSKLAGPELARLARELLTQASPNRQNQHLNFAIVLLIKRFMSVYEGEPYARQMLRVIRKGLDNYSLSPYDIDETLQALFETQPTAALDELIGDEQDDADDYIRRRALRADHTKNALSGVPAEKLVEWCKQGDQHRWIRVADAVPAFNEEQDLKWSETAQILLRSAPNPIQVAGALVERIEPMSWSGSRAEAISSRMPLIDELSMFLPADASENVSQWRKHYQQVMERERRRELEDHRRDNERFE